MRILILIVAGLALLSPVSRADVLQKSRVPAGARWIAHVDIERLMGSELFTSLEGGALGKAFDIDLDDVDELCGLDPLKDLKSVTFFSTSESDENTVGVVVVSSKVEQALACFQREPGYHTLVVGARTLHVWNEHHGADGDDEASEIQYGYLLPIEGSSDRLAVIAGKPEALVEAVDVLEGKAPNLANTAKPNLSASPGPGAIVFAAAGEPLARLAQIEPASAIAKLAQVWTFELGESSRALYADLWIRTSTSEEALRVQQALQGVVALLSLAMSDPETSAKVQPVLSALTFNANGNQMNARFRYNVQELLGLLQTLAASDDGDGAHADKKVRHQKKIHIGDEK